jgi:hypothetical protein
MDSLHDHILINIKDQLKDYIDKCLTAQEQEAPEPEAGGAKTLFLLGNLDTRNDGVYSGGKC